MKKILLLNVLCICLVSGQVTATDLKYGSLMQKMEPLVMLNKIPFASMNDKNDKFVNFEKETPGLGYHRVYYSDPKTHCTTSFYIYDQNMYEVKIDNETKSVSLLQNKNKNAPIDWTNIPIETAQAYAGIAYVHPDLNPEAPEIREAVKEGLVIQLQKQELQAKYGEIDEAPTVVLVGETKYETMGVGVTAYEGNFLKVRMTCYKTVSPKTVKNTIIDSINWFRKQLQ